MTFDKENVAGPNRPIAKCLGVAWSTNEEGDSFITHQHWNKTISELSKETELHRAKCKKEDKNTSTKFLSERLISATVGKAFDPIGLLSPIIFPGKVCLSYTWQSKVN